MWVGFVEDLKWAVAVGLAAWVGAVIMTFTGSAPVPGPVPGFDAGTADAAEPAASGRTVASEKLVEDAAAYLEAQGFERVAAKSVEGAQPGRVYQVL